MDCQGIFSIPFLTRFINVAVLHLYCHRLAIPASNKHQKCPPDTVIIESTRHLMPSPYKSPFQLNMKPDLVVLEEFLSSLPVFKWFFFDFEQFIKYGGLGSLFSLSRD